MDSLLTCWSNFSEEFLCKRASVDSSASTGRGKTPRFVKQPNCGVNRPIEFLGSQTTVEERCLRKLVRQIAELQLQSPTDLGPWPFRFRHLWSLAARKWRLNFDLGCLDDCKIAALKRDEAISLQQDHAAVARWRQKIKLDFRHDVRPSNGSTGPIDPFSTLSKTVITLSLIPP